MLKDLFLDCIVSLIPIRAIRVFVVCHHACMGVAQVKQNRASPPEVGSTRPSPGTASIQVTWGESVHLHTVCCICIVIHEMTWKNAAQQVNGREGREQSLPPAESPGAMRTGASGIPPCISM